MAAWRDAVPGDAAATHRLLREMAEYERLAFHATAGDCARELFGPLPSARAMLAEDAGEAVGVCLHYRSFPSFAGRPAPWIEYIFVAPSHRRQGLARAAFAQVARLAVEQGCVAVEWDVPDWNGPALPAYRAMGARPCCVRMGSRRWPSLRQLAGFSVFGDSALTHPALCRGTGGRTCG